MRESYGFSLNAEVFLYRVTISLWMGIHFVCWLVLIRRFSVYSWDCLDGDVEKYGFSLNGDTFY